MITFLLSLWALQTGCHSCCLTNFRHKNRTVFPLLPPHFSVTSELLTWVVGNLSAFCFKTGGCDRITHLKPGARE